MVLWFTHDFVDLKYPEVLTTFSTGCLPFLHFCKRAMESRLKRRLQWDKHLSMSHVPLQCLITRGYLSMISSFKSRCVPWSLKISLEFNSSSKACTHRSCKRGQLVLLDCSNDIIVMPAINFQWFKTTVVAIYIFVKTCYFYGIIHKPIFTGVSWCKQNWYDWRFLIPIFPIIWLVSPRGVGNLPFILLHGSFQQLTQTSAWFPALPTGKSPINAGFYGKLMCKWGICHAWLSDRVFQQTTFPLFDLSLTCQSHIFCWLKHPENIAH